MNQYLMLIELIQDNLNFLQNKFDMEKNREDFQLHKQITPKENELNEVVPIPAEIQESKNKTEDVIELISFTDDSDEVNPQLQKENLNKRKSKSKTLEKDEISIDENEQSDSIIEGEQDENSQESLEFELGDETKEKLENEKNRINMKDTKNPQDNEQFVKKVPSYEHTDRNKIFDTKNQINMSKSFVDKILANLKNNKDHKQKNLQESEKFSGGEDEEESKENLSVGGGSRYAEDIDDSNLSYIKRDSMNFIPRNSSINHSTYEDLRKEGKVWNPYK